MKIDEALRKQNLYFESNKGKSFRVRLYKAAVNYTLWCKGKILEERLGSNQKLIRIIHRRARKAKDKKLVFLIFINIVPIVLVLLTLLITLFACL